MALPVTNSPASALYGAGNSAITAEQIKAIINTPGRTAAEIQKLAEANGVSVEQISQAMAGDENFSAQSISSYLAVQGDTPAAAAQTTPLDPAAAAAILYGQGNPELSDADIAAFINQPGRTAEQVLDAALANHVSAEQIARAMAGHPEFTLEHIRQALTALGISPPAESLADPLDFRAETLFGAGNPAISAQQIQDFVSQPNVTSQQILAAAIEHGVSVEQLAAALSERPEFSLANIINYIESQGIATERDPSRYLNLQSSLLYASGNAAISDDEIRAYIERPDRSENQIINAALANGVSLAQIAKAMDGHPAFTLQNLVDAVGFKQDFSSLEVLMLKQDQLLKALDAAPSAAASQQAIDALRADLAKLEPQLEEARTKVDARIAQGQAQDAIAAQAENDAAALKAQFDPLQLEKLHAQAKTDEQQGKIDAAQSEVKEAQAALDAANQAIADAAHIKKKSRRHRARGEAQYAAKAASEALAAAQQKVAELQPALAQTQADAAPAFAAAQAMQTRWETAQKIADAERAKANVLLGAAQRAVQLEVALKQALTSDELQLVQRGQSQAAQLQKQIDAGELTGAARTAALKSIELDTTEAAELTQKIDAQATQDRLRESALAQAAVPLQTQAYGAALIAQNLVGDAARLDQAQADVSAQLAQAQTDLAAASQRLLDAKTALAKADFAVDWDQAKKDTAKSSQALAIDQPKLDAAQAELDAAQQAFDALQAKVSTLQHLASPLGAATLDAAYAAGSAVQRASTAASQANAALGWVNLAQARYESSDQLLAATQVGLIQTTLAEGTLKPQADPAWAQQYSQQVSDARAAAQSTRAAQSAQNELAIQAGGAQILSVFLKDKVTHASTVYAQAQAQLAVQQEDFQKATAHASELAPAAEQARQELADADLNAAFAFALTRSTLSPEQLSAAQADKAGFVKTWQDKEMASRTTERKQIHLLDDLAQFQKDDPAAQAARQHVLDTAHALEQATQAATDAGDTVQASLTITGLLGQSVASDQLQLAQANAGAADLSAQVGAHALVLGDAAKNEVATLQRSSNPANAATVELAGQIAAQMPQSGTDWAQAAQAWKAQAANEASTLATLKTQIASDETARSELQTKIQTSAAEVEQAHGFALGVLKSVADRDEHADELHRDRKLFDDAHKRAKKGGLLKILMMVGITIAAAAATIASVGALSAPMATLEAAALGAIYGTEAAVAAAVTAGEMTVTLVQAGIQAATWGVAGAVGSAAQQGLSIAVGEQDKFSWGNLGISALTAAATAGLFSSVGSRLSAGVLSGMRTLGAVELLGAETAGHVASGLAAAGVNTAVQGGMLGLDLQKEFSWGQMAAMGITAGLSSSTSQWFRNVTQDLSGLKYWAADLGYNSLVNTAGMGVAQAGSGKFTPGELVQAFQFGGKAGLGVHESVPTEKGLSGFALNEQPVSNVKTLTQGQRDFRSSTLARGGGDVVQPARFNEPSIHLAQAEPERVWVVKDPAGRRLPIGDAEMIIPDPDPHTDKFWAVPQEQVEDALFGKVPIKDVGYEAIEIEKPPEVPSEDPPSRKKNPTDALVELRDTDELPARPGERLPIAPEVTVTTRGPGETSELTAPIKGEGGMSSMREVSTQMGGSKGGGQNEGKDLSDRVVEAQIAQLDLIGESLGVSDSTNLAKILLAHNSHEPNKSDYLPAADLSTQAANRGAAEMQNGNGYFALAKPLTFVVDDALQAVGPMIEYAADLEKARANLHPDGVIQMVLDHFDKSPDVWERLDHPSLAMKNSDPSLSSSGKRSEIYSPENVIDGILKNKLKITPSTKVEEINILEEALLRSSQSAIGLAILARIEKLPFNIEFSGGVGKIKNKYMHLRKFDEHGNIIENEASTLYGPGLIAREQLNQFLDVHIDGEGKLIVDDEYAPTLMHELTHALLAHLKMQKVEAFMAHKEYEKFSDQEKLSFVKNIVAQEEDHALLIENLVRKELGIKQRFPVYSSDKIRLRNFTAIQINKAIQEGIISKDHLDRLLVVESGGNIRRRHPEEMVFIDLDTLDIRLFTENEIRAQLNGKMPALSSGQYKIKVIGKLTESTLNLLENGEISFRPDGQEAVTFKSAGGEEMVMVLMPDGSKLLMHPNAYAILANKVNRPREPLPAAPDVTVPSVRGLNNTSGLRGADVDRAAVHGPRSSIDPKTNSFFDESVPMKDGRSGFALNEHEQPVSNVKTLTQGQRDFRNSTLARGGSDAVQPARFNEPSIHLAQAESERVWMVNDPAGRRLPIGEAEPIIQDTRTKKFWAVPLERLEKVMSGEVPVEDVGYEAIEIRTPPQVPSEDVPSPKKNPIDALVELRDADKLPAPPGEPLVHGLNDASGLRAPFDGALFHAAGSTVLDGVIRRAHEPTPLNIGDSSNSAQPVRLASNDDGLPAIQVAELAETKAQRKPNGPGYSDEVNDVIEYLKQSDNGFNGLVLGPGGRLRKLGPQDFPIINDQGDVKSLTESDIVRLVNEGLEPGDLGSPVIEVVGDIDAPVLKLLEQGTYPYGTAKEPVIYRLSNGVPRVEIPLPGKAKLVVAPELFRTMAQSRPDGVTVKVLLPGVTPTILSPKEFLDGALDRIQKKLEGGAAPSTSPETKSLLDGMENILGRLASEADPANNDFDVVHVAANEMSNVGSDARKYGLAMPRVNGVGLSPKSLAEALSAETNVDPVRDVMGPSVIDDVSAAARAVAEQSRAPTRHNVYGGNTSLPGHSIIYPDNLPKIFPSVSSNGREVLAFDAKSTPEYIRDLQDTVSAVRGNPFGADQLRQVDDAARSGKRTYVMQANHPDFAKRNVSAYALPANMGMAVNGQGTDVFILMDRAKNEAASWRPKDGVNRIPGQLFAHEAQHAEKIHRGELDPVYGDHNVFAYDASFEAESKYRIAAGYGPRSDYIVSRKPGDMWFIPEILPSEVRAVVKPDGAGDWALDIDQLLSGQGAFKIDSSNREAYASMFAELGKYQTGRELLVRAYYAKAPIELGLAGTLPGGSHYAEMAFDPQAPRVEGAGGAGGQPSRLTMSAAARPSTEALIELGGRLRSAERVANGYADARVNFTAAVRKSLRSEISIFGTKADVDGKIDALKSLVDGLNLFPEDGTLNKPVRDEIPSPNVPKSPQSKSSLDGIENILGRLASQADPANNRLGFAHVAANNTDSVSSDAPKTGLAVVQRADSPAHADEPPTILSAFLSAADGYGDSAVRELGSMAQSQIDSRFSLAEAVFYPVSNWISDGATEQLANSPDAPEHVLKAKASYEATKDFVSNLSPGNEISGALDFAAAKIDAIKNLELPLERLMAQWQGAQTNEDWYNVGSHAALFSVAAAGIILPNGKVKNGPYEVDGEIWPKSGTQQTAYRDGDTVFKHANEVVTFNAGGPDEKILGLSVPERIMLKNEIVTHQNRFGSHLPAGVFPKATELDGIWMRQNYIGGKVPNGLVGSEELAFLADRDLYVNMAVDSLSIKHKSTFKMFDDNSGFVYRVGNTLVASDWDRRNLRIHDGKTYWFDPAMVWPLELLNNKK